MKFKFETCNIDKYSISEEEIDDYLSNRNTNAVLRVDDIHDDLGDIWLLLLDWVEKKICRNQEIYDQNGGEFNDISIENDKNICGEYTLYGIQFNRNSKVMDLNLLIYGFFEDPETLIIEEIEIKNYEELLFTLNSNSI